MQTIQNMTFFWGSTDVLSNWHSSQFKLGGVTFSCMEQYLMYAKAALFGDMKTASEILKAVAPKDHKALGRNVTPFVQAVWDANRMPIVVRGLLAKFRQNPAMARVLLETDTTVLVEASPYDDIWGVKLRADHPDILDPEKWRGLNLLGQALETVRGVLQREVDWSRRAEFPAVDENLRRAFEAWALTQGIQTRNEWLGHTYLNAQARDAWRGYQGATAEATDWVLVKGSAVDCAHHLAALSENLIDAFNEQHAAEECDDEVRIDAVRSDISEHCSGIRTAVYEMRKRLPSRIAP